MSERLTEALETAYRESREQRLSMLIGKTADCALYDALNRMESNAHEALKILKNPPRRAALSREEGR